MDRITPARLDPAEDYATVDDLLSVADLVELTVRVPHWHRNGAPIALRVRALNLEQQDEIRMLGARAVAPEDRAHGVRYHWPTYVVATLQRGIIAPTLTPEQALAFRRKNGRACELLVDFIWEISAVAQERIDAHLLDLARESAGLDVAPAPPQP